MKVCSECRFFSSDRTLLNPQKTATCSHPDAATRDPVYGLCQCEIERSGTKGCGKAGKLWEARPSK